MDIDGFYDLRIELIETDMSIKGLEGFRNYVEEELKKTNGYTNEDIAKSMSDKLLILKVENRISHLKSKYENLCNELNVVSVRTQ